MPQPAPPEAPADHLLGVYNRAPLAFDRGRGARLYTADGDAYLDCLAGIATTGLGHAHTACCMHGPAKHAPHSHSTSPPISHS